MITNIYDMAREVHENNITQVHDESKSGTEIIYDALISNREYCVNADLSNGKIIGKSELKADWVNAKAMTTQEQLSGKNLFDMSASTLYDSDKKCLVATTYAQNTRRTLSQFCKTIKAGDSIALSGTTSGLKTIYLEQAKVYCDFGTTKIITQDMLDSAVVVYTSTTAHQTPVDIYIQIELGTTATTYEPYCGGIPSPNPDYPQPLVTNIPAGTYKVPCTQPKGGYWEFDLPELNGLTGYQDVIEIDEYSGVGRYKQNTGKITLDGSQIPNIKNWRPFEDSYGCVYPYSLTNNILVSSIELYPSLSTNFSSQSYKDLFYGTKHGFSFYSTTQAGLCLRVPSSIVTSQIELDTWLSSNLPTFVYPLATPTTTPLTLTWVATSTATDLPVTSMGITEPSPDYPLSIVDALTNTSGNTVNWVREGRNLFNSKHYILSNNGITTTLDESGRLVISGEATTSVNIDGYSPVNPLYLAKGKYRLFGLENTDAVFRCFYVQNNKFGDVVLGGFDIKNGVITVEKEYPVAIRIFIRSGSVFNNKVCEIQLETETTSTPYTPYIPPQTIDLSPVGKLGGVDSVSDYLEWDGKQWWKVENAAKLVLDGTDKSIIREVSRLSDRSRFATATLYPENSFNTQLLCSHLLSTGTFNSVYVGANFWLSLYLTDDLIGVVNTDTVNERITKANRWLVAQYAAGTPVTVRYQLATPIRTKLGLPPPTTAQKYSRIYIDNSIIPPIIDTTAKCLGN